MMKVRLGSAISLAIAMLTGISSCGRQQPKNSATDQRPNPNIPAATAKPLPPAGDKPSAGIPQPSPAQLMSGMSGAASSPVAHAPTTTKPASAEAPRSASQPAPQPNTLAPASLSGSWHGTFTHQSANQIANVTLHLEDRADLLTGTLTFDPGGENSASCSLKGSYNLLRRFLVLLIGACQGRPPSYLQGQIGFTSVNLNDRRIVGVEPRQNGVLDISR